MGSGASKSAKNGSASTNSTQGKPPPNEKASVPKTLSAPAAKSSQTNGTGPQGTKSTPSTITASKSSSSQTHISNPPPNPPAIKQDTKGKTLLKREKTRIEVDLGRMKTKYDVMADKIGKIERKRENWQKIRHSVVSRHFDAAELSADETELLLGNIDVQVPSTSKIVRIFTSSTFTDTKHERNYLMERAYPKLKTFTQQFGYEFQVVDMRWGVRDEATDDHMTTEICLKEMKLCQKLSTGPNCVSLMSHKYGYTAFPRVIEAKEYEALMKNIESKDTLKLFQKWYKKDENADPPCYVICSISTLLPNFISSDKEKKNEAKAIWWKESEEMQNALAETASRIFDDEKGRKYIMSVTEAEIRLGILDTKDPSEHCLWLKRTIDNIEELPSSYLLSRYIECTGPEEKWQKSRQLLKDLKDNRMTKVLPKENILSSNVKWNDKGGIDPEKDSSHKSYLLTMCKDFVSKMSSMIKESIEEKTRSKDLLLQEVAQHTKFCQEKCENFHGRDSTLKAIKGYICAMSSEALVLHGASGCGKTSIMAMAAKHARTWLDNKPVVVLRFIGTSPESSSIKSLLRSIVTQIQRAYRVDRDIPEDMSGIIDAFKLSLSFPSTKRPLVLILDSLDQLDPGDAARQLKWFPRKLRGTVRLVTSTLPDDKYECFPILKEIVSNGENFLPVPNLPDNDVSGIIDKWLTLKKRKLTDDQKKILLSAFKNCPLPLFLKLSFDEASTWKSYSPKKDTVLQATVRASIDNLFQRMEVLHGKIFVSRALGYLTLAKNGITEAELEDVLSCDDDVLNDVYMYWTPPMRRLPPLLLVRLKMDLGQYLVDRGVDNVTVMNWYHRQFIEAARSRYCSDPTVAGLLHSALADFFSGIWHGKKKPFKTNSGEQKEEERFVASQPLMFSSTPNLRKLNNLPYHRTLAKQLDPLKSESLCNYEFLLTKLKALSLWPVLDDFVLAKKAFPNDESLTLINEVMHLAQDAILYDPRQFAPQMIGRLEKRKSTEEFLEQCQKSSDPFLLPNKKILIQPGGQLLHSMAGHAGQINSLAMSKDGKSAVSCDEYHTVISWNLEEGRQDKNFDFFEDAEKVSYCMNDQFFLVEIQGGICVRHVQSGDKKFEINENDDLAITGKSLMGSEKHVLGLFTDESIEIYDLKKEIKVASAPLPKKFGLTDSSQCVGSKSMTAVTNENSERLTVFHLKTKTFTKIIRGFELVKLDDDDEDPTERDIDELAISPDEKFVAYGNIYDNNIELVNPQTMEKIRTIKGSAKDFMVGLKFTLDGNSLYFGSDTNIIFLDHKTSKRTDCLEHPASVSQVSTVDNKRVITAAEDSLVRIWDRTKTKQVSEVDKSIQGKGIRHLLPLPNSRYVVGVGDKEDGSSHFIFVYDIIKNVTVREAALDTSVVLMKVVDNKKVLIQGYKSRVLRAYDLDKMAQICRFQGKLARHSNSIEVLLQRNEVIATCRGRLNLKFYDLSSCKAVAIMKGGQKNEDRIFELFVNKEETVVIAQTDGPLFIFDIPQRKLLHAIQLSAMKVESLGYDTCITPDGKYAMLQVDRDPPPPFKQKDAITETYVVTWDIQKGKEVAACFDGAYYKKYQESGGGQSTNIDTMKILDNNRLICSLDDYAMRVYDIKTGKILKMIHGHTTSVEMSVNPNLPHFVTYGCWAEENAIRLWDKQTFNSIASFKMDRSVVKVTLSQDGKFIIACISKPLSIIAWKLHNAGPDWEIDSAKLFENYQGEKKCGNLALLHEDDDKEDQNDPDKDVDEPDEDSDDDVDDKDDDDDDNFYTDDDEDLEV